MKLFTPWSMLPVKLIAACKSRVYGLFSDHPATIVLTQYAVKADWQAVFQEMLNRYKTACLATRGNIVAEEFYEHGDPCTMWIVERWRNQAVYNKHKRSIATKAIDTLANIALATPADVVFVTELDLFSKAMPLHTEGENDQVVTIMLIIDVKPGTEEYFKSINHTLMLALQNEPGVLFFQFGQEVAHTSRFIVYKKFRNWQIFQQHLKEPSLEPIMHFLKTSVQDPPFEKNYHHLIPFASQ